MICDAAAPVSNTYGSRDGKGVPKSTWSGNAPAIRIAVKNNNILGIETKI